MEIDFDQISEQLEGYSGSDIRLVCKEAAMKPLRRLMFQIDQLEQGGDNDKKAGILSHKIDPKNLPGLGQVTAEDL